MSGETYACAMHQMSVDGSSCLTYTCCFCMVSQTRIGNALKDLQEAGLLPQPPATA